MENSVKTYKVIPFKANISARGSASDAAAQLEKLSNEMANTGWKYVRMEEVTTNVAGTSACFGLRTTPPYTVSVSMIVFEK